MIHTSTKQRIRRFWAIDGFSLDEILLMYREYPATQIINILRGVKKAERI